MLVTSNFFFSHKVFKSCLLLMRQNEYIWSEGLIQGSLVRVALDLLCFFSSPEHEVLIVSYWDSAVSGVRRPSSVVRRASSVVNFLPCVRSRGHSFGRILMKVGQDVCLDEISDEFENGSCGVKN